MAVSNKANLERERERAREKEKEDFGKLYNSTELSSQCYNNNNNNEVLDLNTLRISAGLLPPH
jgi:hypothetical protein